MKSLRLSSNVSLSILPEFGYDLKRKRPLIRPQYLSQAKRIKGADSGITTIHLEMPVRYD